MALEPSNDARPGSEEKAILGSFTALLGVAMVWIGFFFGVLQPWMDGYL